MSRIRQPMWIAFLVVCLAVGSFAKWQQTNGRAVPAPVSILLWALLVVFCALGLVQFLRASAASDRPPLSMSHGWLVFLVIEASLLGVPVISIVTDDPERDPVAGAVMIVVGLVLAGVFVWYIRKPVLDHGVLINDFWTDDRRRGRSPTVSYGRAWTVGSDFSGVYAVTWLRDTKEICAVRSRRLPGRLRLDFPDSLSNPLGGGSGTVEVLGWAEDEATLDRALAGWQQHMDRADSLSWVRARLAQAATETSRLPR